MLLPQLPPLPSPPPAVALAAATVPPRPAPFASLRSLTPPLAPWLPAACPPFALPQKVNSAVEGTVNKVRRQLVELQSTAAPEDRADVWVEGQTPEGYLQRFAWNEAKYPSRRPLKEIVASIMETVQKLDDDLKVGAGCWVLGTWGLAQARR